jgi:NADH-quinone oxidoreductase subunit J
MIKYIFWILAVSSVISALAVVLTRHPVRSVLFLVVTFFCISGQYILMNAQFLAVVNIIVYAGAIMVLFLFVLMLLNLSKETEPQKSNVIQFIAVICAGMLLITLIAALRDASAAQDVVNDIQRIGLVKELGRKLFSDYVIPFEVSSILFIAAMVGAVLLGKREPVQTNETPK